MDYACSPPQHNEDTRAGNSMRIRESIHIMIHIASTNENHFFLLNPIVVVMVAIKFDSRKLEWGILLNVFHTYCINEFHIET